MQMAAGQRSKPQDIYTAQHTQRLLVVAFPLGIFNKSRVAVPL
jgi:hypothetical protein